MEMPRPLRKHKSAKGARAVISFDRLSRCASMGLHLFPFTFCVATNRFRLFVIDEILKVLAHKRFHFFWGQMCCHLLFLIFSFLEVSMVEPDGLDLLILLECLSLYLF